MAVISKFPISFPRLSRQGFAFTYIHLAETFVQRDVKNEVQSNLWWIKENPWRLSVSHSPDTNGRKLQVHHVMRVVKCLSDI